LKALMMTQIFKSIAVLVAVLLGLVTPARAVPVNALMQASFSGVIVSGNDAHNIFGGSLLLDGEAFLATFKYDTTIGRHTSPVIDQIFGGLSLGSKSPIISASITINNVSYDFLGWGYGEASLSQGGGRGSFYLSAQDPLYGTGLSLTEYRNDAALPISLSTPFSLAGANLLPPGSYAQGLVNFGSGSADLAIHSITVTSLSPVPLPAGLPMLVSGIMALGFTARRSGKSPHAG
jgi:hypothetical protein